MQATTDTLFFELAAECDTLCLLVRPAEHAPFPTPLPLQAGTSMTIVFSCSGSHPAMQLWRIIG